MKPLKSRLRDAVEMFERATAPFRVASEHRQEVLRRRQEPQFVDRKQVILDEFNEIMEYYKDKVSDQHPS